ncbi:MAG: hypothetical protein ACI4NJ_00650 [Cellvibrio sp.]
MILKNVFNDLEVEIAFVGVQFTVKVTDRNGYLITTDYFPKSVNGQRFDPIDNIAIAGISWQDGD